MPVPHQSDSLETRNLSVEEQLLLVENTPLVMTEQTAPATPTTGRVAIYPKTDGKPYSKDDAGTEYDLTAGSGTQTKTIVLFAAGGQPTLTGGCAAAAQKETTTNDVNYWSLDFDQTTEEYAFWLVVMPDGYNGGTITARFLWTSTAGPSGVTWGISGRSFGNNEDLDQALGTEVLVNDLFLSSNDIHISDATAAVTLSGTPAGGEAVYIRIARKTGDAGDGVAADAQLLAVQIEYSASLGD
jgi:hypothetical protein